MKLLCFLLVCLCSFALVSSGSNNSTDEIALLSFKSMLSSGLPSFMASWNASSHFCMWPGVVCGRRHPDRVVALRMSSFNLSGGISPFLGNLSFLTMLDLHDNQLVGTVPWELGHLSKLQVLNLSANYLEGSIPVTLGGCTKLKMLDLSTNRFQGEIPYEVGNLKYLVSLNLAKNGLSGVIPLSISSLLSIKYLSLNENKLSGELPSSLGNLTNLHLLQLSNNMLTGTIPSSWSMLPSLSWLNLAFNNLSGMVPSTLWNLSSLAVFSVQTNTLSGAIPFNAFDNVPRMEKLYMNDNHFHGPIPSSISNASGMTLLQLDTNLFDGLVPLEVGSLKNLIILQIYGNSFHAKEPKDWEFITALTNCSQLQLLGLSDNKFMGFLPATITNLSTSLSDLYLDGNRISGSIPKDIGNLINLETLLLEYNFFTGSLPSSLFKLENLVMLYAFSNNISGSIPPALGNLTELTYLQLDQNSFSGIIPSTLGNLTKLWGLGLSDNQLTGPIPSRIFDIPALSRFLDISYNYLEGTLPEEIGNLKNLIEFDAQSNKLSGKIPTTIGECQLIQYISLQNNILNGSIPIIFGQIRGLEKLDLSRNNLTGEVPKPLGNLSMLHYLNLSFNNLAGEVPNYGVFTNVTAISIQGNDKLCGGIPDLHLATCSLHLPKRKRRQNILVVPIITSLVTAVVILPLLCMLLIWHKKRKAKIPATQSMDGHPFISYSQLVRATNGFSATNLLGSGTFGSVYKGELNSEQDESITLVAVKVLKLQTPQAVKSFKAECEALRSMRHRNLVKIITVCSSIDSRGSDFKAIVYDFMSNGSLERWLHLDTNDQAEQRYLNLFQRVAVLLDVAYALDYLHCHGPEPVVHCDLKSSNVLLDDDMVAHLGDFGLAKILIQGVPLMQQSTSSVGFRGTIGYAAPEYGAGNMVSTQGDVYSYGILVLETVTGKRPTDSRFRQGLSPREYVHLALQNKVTDVVDTRLSLDLENDLDARGDTSYQTKVDCIVSLLELGMSCTQESPSRRMPTGGIVKDLLGIKDSLTREHNT